MTRFFTLIALVLAFAGLAQAQTPTPEVAEASDEGPSEQDEARRARTYARMGDERLTVGDLEDQIALQAPIMREQLRQPRRLQEFADGLVRSMLLAKEAERRGYGENAAVQRSYKESLVQNIIRIQIDEQNTRESITTEAIGAYFEAHAEEFRRPAMSRAAHILFDSREAAEAILEEARAADARDFRNLVRQHSIDTETKFRGGDLRYFMRNGRSPSATAPVREDGPATREPDPPVDSVIVEAAFALETVGDVSDIIQTGEYFTIIKLTGRRLEEQRTLASAADGIRVKLWRERRSEAMSEFASELRQNAAVEIQADLLRVIHLDPVDAAPAFPAHGEMMRQRASAMSSAMEAQPVSPPAEAQAAE
ncbi:MAG: parvulin-like peptidyl-prolyl isomerase [Polyangiales bacterium]|jgi:parvulin-like peptidyl-prolyl isomerase